MMRNRIAYSRLRKVSLIKYGRLYNYPAANNANIAPIGWTVPSDSDWSTLTTYINNTYNGAPNNFGVGNHLKHRRKNGTPSVSGFNTETHPRWDADGSNYGRDTVYFGALPGGRYNTNGTFSLFAGYGFFRSTTAGNNCRRIDFNSGDVTAVTNLVSENGMAIRCFRLASATEQLLPDKAHRGQVLDIDGNVYDTIKIGTQVWMVQNLATTKLNDGTAITLVTTGSMSNSEANYNNISNDAANSLFDNHENSIWKPNDFVI